MSLSVLQCVALCCSEKLESSGFQVLGCVAVCVAVCVAACVVVSDLSRADFKSLSVLQCIAVCVAVCLLQ